VEKSDPANAIRIRGARAPALECRRGACVCNSSAAFSYWPLHEPVPSRLPANSPRSSRLDRRESGERRIREGHCVRSPSLAHAACDRRSAASQVAKCSPIRCTKRETVLSATRTGERGGPKGFVNLRAAVKEPSPPFWVTTTKEVREGHVASIIVSCKSALIARAPTLWAGALLTRLAMSEWLTRSRRARTPYETERAFGICHGLFVGAGSTADGRGRGPRSAVDGFGTRLSSTAKRLVR
jgi:hypothetical protein